MRCFTLIVPEDRSDPVAERVVRLPVVIIGARDGPGRAEAPVLWVDYGAGDGFLLTRVKVFSESPIEINEQARRDRPRPPRQRSCRAVAGVP